MSTVLSDKDTFSWSIAPHHICSCIYVHIMLNIVTVYDIHTYIMCFLLETIYYVLWKVDYYTMVFLCSYLYLPISWQSQHYYYFILILKFYILYHSETIFCWRWLVNYHHPVVYMYKSSPQFEEKKNNDEHDIRWMWRERV